MAANPGLVLSGGFLTFGAIQVGLLMALKEFGLLEKIKFIAGCSVGAVNGVMAAADGVNPRHDRIAELKEIWMNLKPEHLWRPRPFPQSVLHSNALNDFVLDEYVATLFDMAELYRDVRDSPRELVIITANLSRVCIGVFSSRRHAPAVMRKAAIASASMPGVFPPVSIRGDIHVDGGELKPIPLTYAYKAGAAPIICSYDPRDLPRFAAARHIHEVIARVAYTGGKERELRERRVADGITRNLTHLFLLQERIEAAIAQELAHFGRKQRKLYDAVGNAFGAAEFSFKNNVAAQRIDIAPFPVVDVNAVISPHKPQLPFFPKNQNDLSGIPRLIQQGYDETVAILRKEGLIA